MSFRYLGNVSGYFPIDRVWKEIENRTDWVDHCSPQVWKQGYRNDEEKELIQYYNTHNAVQKSFVLQQDDWLGNAFFHAIDGDQYRPTLIKVYNTLPGHFRPPHKDYYTSFVGKHLTPSDAEKLADDVVRVIIMLEDSKLGHLNYSEDGLLSKWHKGDMFLTPSKTTHGNCNGGIENYYTLLITAWRCGS